MLNRHMLGLTLLFFGVGGAYLLHGIEIKTGTFLVILAPIIITIVIGILALANPQKLKQMFS